MTNPAPPDAAAQPAKPLAPSGLRIASTLCWVVGMLTILATVSVELPTVGQAPEASAFFAINLLAGVVVCIAGYLVRTGRKVGAYLVVAAWAAPTLLSLLGGGGAKTGNVLLLIALVALLFSWKHLE